MNVLAPFVAVLQWAWSWVMDASFQQVAGMSLIVLACVLEWGVIGGLVAGGVALVLVGISRRMNDA